MSKDKKMKGIAIPSGVTGLLGITEPAMFGVNLKLRYPFIAAVCAAALSSAFITMFNVKAQALGQLVFQASFPSRRIRLVTTSRVW